MKKQTFSAIADHVVFLANERQALSQRERDARLEAAGVREPTAIGRAWADWELYKADLGAGLPPRSPWYRALRFYLESLDARTLLKLQTLLYIGRGDADADGLRWMWEHLSGLVQPASAIYSIKGKIVAGEYIAKGLVKVRAAGVDVEAAFGPLPRTATAYEFDEAAGAGTADPEES